MLVVSRRLGETIRINNDISIVITRISNSQVKVGITAPKNVRIARGELCANDAFNRKNISISEREPVT
jgi:carbon storage regulator